MEELGTGFGEAFVNSSIRHLHIAGSSQRCQHLQACFRLREPTKHQHLHQIGPTELPLPLIQPVWRASTFARSSKIYLRERPTCAALVIILLLLTINILLTLDSIADGASFTSALLKLVRMGAKMSGLLIRAARTATPRKASLG